MGQISTIPTRRTVQTAWDRYQALVLLLADDPVLAADPNQQIALRRAHERWSRAFTEWSGE